MAICSISAHWAGAGLRLAAHVRAEVGQGAGAADAVVGRSAVVLPTRYLQDLRQERCLGVFIDFAGDVRETCQVVPAAVGDLAAIKRTFEHGAGEPSADFWTEYRRQQCGFRGTGVKQRDVRAGAVAGRVPARLRFSPGRALGQGRRPRG